MPRERWCQAQDGKTCETASLDISTEPAEHPTNDTTHPAVSCGTVLAMDNWDVLCLMHRLRTTNLQSASNLTKIQYHQAHVMQDD